MQFPEFPQHVQPDVFRRGQDVHALGKVLDFSEFKPGEWIARIEGSNGHYQTEMVLGENEVKSWQCNCPYRESPVCKHTVGLYTAIALEMQYREFRARTGLPQKLRARPSFHSLVKEQTNHLEQETLQELLANMGKWNPQVRKEFEEAIARMEPPPPGQPPIH